MVQVDVSITDTEYNQMMAVLNAMRIKLGPLRAVLTKMLASQPAKVKAFAATDAGRFLREVYRVRRDLNTFFGEIGWEED